MANKMKQAGKHFDIIVTVNPADLSVELIEKFVEYGATIFRLNGSFLLSNGVEKMISLIRSTCGNTIDILLDLPGFKPRFTYLKEELHYAQGIPFAVPLGSINYPDIITHMKKGDSLRINNGMVRLEIKSIDNNNIVFMPDKSGVLRRGKGFYLEKRGYRPAFHCLSDNDFELIDMAKESGIDFVGISFIHNMNDIKIIKDALKGSNTGFIPKIEARESYDQLNLCSMLKECDQVILDRGDTAGELGLDSIWYEQRRVLDLAKIFNCRVVMATQFFTNMLKHPLPSIAEVDSFYDLVQCGIDGVQFSEETCVGDHGFDVIKFVVDHLVVQNSNMTQERLGNVLWIMGPTSSGKTTIAGKIESIMARTSVPVVHLDGDAIRDLFGTDFGFSSQDRLRIVRTLVHHAKKAVEKGHNVVVSALTAHEDARQLVKDSFQGEKICIIFLDCPIEECKKRDPKGLYKKAQLGEINTLVGLNSAYSPPKYPDLTLRTDKLDIDECVDFIIDYISMRWRFF